MTAVTPQIDNLVLRKGHMFSSYAGERPPTLPQTMAPRAGRRNTTQHIFFQPQRRLVTPKLSFKVIPFRFLGSFGMEAQWTKETVGGRRFKNGLPHRVVTQRPIRVNVNIDRAGIQSETIWRGCATWPGRVMVSRSGCRPERWRLRDTAGGPLTRINSRCAFLDGFL